MAKIAEGIVEIKADSKSYENTLKKIPQDAEKTAKKIEAAFKKGTIKLDTKLAQMDIKQLQAKYSEFEKALKRDQKLGLSQAGIARTKKDLDSVKQKLNEAGVEAGKTQSKFSSMVKGFAIGAVLIKGVQLLKNFTKEAIASAAKVEGIKSAFDKLNQPGLLSNIQKATRGTVNNLELMQRAVMADNFKIPLDQLATYFKFATNRAIETGQSVDYLVESIITGVGRKSVLVMDNLGISAVELQQETAKVGDFGKAAGVIIQRELAKAGNVADTLATKMSKISAATDNFTVTAGQAMVKLLDSISKGVFGFDDLTSLINDQSRKIKDFFNIKDVNLSYSVDNLKKSFEGLNKTEIAKKISEYQNKLFVARKGAKDFEIANSGVFNAAQKVAEALNKTTNALGLTNNEGSKGTKVFQEAKKRLTEYNNEIEYTENAFKALKQIYTEINLGIRDENGNLIDNKDKRLTVNNLIQEEIRLSKELAKARKTGMVEDIEAALKAYEEIKKKLEEVTGETIESTKKIKAHKESISSLEKQLKTYEEQLGAINVKETEKRNSIIKNINAINKQIESEKTLNEILKKRPDAMDLTDPNLKREGKLKPGKPRKADFSTWEALMGKGAKLPGMDKLEIAKDSSMKLNKVLDPMDELLKDLESGAKSFGNALTQGLSSAIARGEKLTDIGNRLLEIFLNVGLNFLTGGILSGLGLSTGGFGKAGGGVTKAANGAFGSIPNGFPNDTFPFAPNVLAQSGETFAIAPKGKSMGEFMGLGGLESKIDKLIQVTVNGNQILATKDMSVNIMQERSFKVAQKITKSQSEINRTGYKVR